MHTELTTPAERASRERQIVRARTIGQAQQTFAEISRLHREYLALRRPLQARAKRLIGRLERP